jgi:hypothetical protein
VLGDRYSPWRDLRARPHVTLRWAWFAHRTGEWEPHADGTATIWLDYRLTRRERRCVLAHELIHDERRIGFPDGCPDALVQAEERMVWRLTVERLVPPAELVELVGRVAPGPVTVLDVAEEFDVDLRVARLACARLG